MDKEERKTSLTDIKSNHEAIIMKTVKKKNNNNNEDCMILAEVDKLANQLEERPSYIWKSDSWQHGRSMSKGGISQK